VRIRVQPSPSDPETLRFLLDAPVQVGNGTARFDAPIEGAPLSGALFAVAGVRQVEVAGACIHVRKATEAKWEDMKAPIASAIRTILAGTGNPLGEPSGKPAPQQDARMLAAVRDLLDSHINPSIATHGGQISAERVTDGTAYLRMSGGCQGCAASQLTLRVGVERKLRAALPDLQAIVDVTDHDAGTRPFYAGRPGTAPRAGFPDSGTATAHPQAGVEMPASTHAPLADRVRQYLEALPPSAPMTSYGALARTLGLWLPGSVRKVTRALEDTMREDAHTGRPFVAARAVSRATDGLPGKGFFDLARELARGPREDETDRAFHTREINRLADVLTVTPARQQGSPGGAGSGLTPGALEDDVGRATAVTTPSHLLGARLTEGELQEVPVIIPTTSLPVDGPGQGTAGPRFASAI
jgi:Fe-S cluster biogenesis protein NfuA